MRVAYCVIPKQSIIKSHIVKRQCKSPPLGGIITKVIIFWQPDLQTLFLNASACCICGPNADRLSTLKPSQIKGVTYGLGLQSLNSVCACITDVWL